MSLPIIRRVSDLRAQVSAWKSQGLRVALVPTMGALHQGHLSLVERALTEADRVLASIFVNPKQFGANEDLAIYPRREAEDAALLAQAGCHLLFAPSVEEVYPSGFSTIIHVEGVSSGACGDCRPGHFQGVATVVTKLLLQSQADIACFGEKDWQQLQVIRRLVTDLDIPVRILSVPTLREEDGLAMSSRNAYLSSEERQIAPALYHLLDHAVQQIVSGGDLGQILGQTQQDLLKAGFDAVEYLEARDDQDFSLISGGQVQRPARLLAAVRLGKTRLIDNLPIL